jgi:hypothetical protein
VNGRIFKVRYSPPSTMPDAMGLCHYDKSLIELRTGQSPLDVRDTLLHEVMHAIRYSQGREYGGKVEEDYVRTLATGLLGVLQDNPEFARWLLLPPNTDSK